MTVKLNEFEKLEMPQDYHLELLILGSLLTGSLESKDVITLEAGNFSTPETKGLFNACKILMEEQKEICFTTIQDLMDSGDKRIAGISLDVLMQSIRAIPSGMSIYTKKDYIAWIDNLKELSQRRRTYIIAKALETDCKGKRDLGATLDHYATSLRKVMPQSDGLMSIKEAVRLAEQESYNVKHGLVKPTLNTGFNCLDNVIHGLHNGSLNLIAARPSVGKTVMAMNIIRNVIQSHQLYEAKKPILFFSLELPAIEIAYRLISSVVHIETESLKRTENWQKNADWHRFCASFEVVTETGNKSLLYVDTKSSDISSLVAKCYQVAEEYNGIGLVVIDYLQRMTAKGEDNRNLELGKISSALKSMALDLNCPVLALSQLNRNIEKQDRDPINSDLRDSGGLESDADTITFITRDLKPSPNQQETDATWHVTKNRFGTVENINLSFVGCYQMFKEHGQPVFYGS